MTPALVLAALWTGWCVLHSALITTPVIEWMRGRMGDRFRFHRILYNVFAIVTLVPIVLYRRAEPWPMLVRWDGPGLVVPASLGVIALIFFVGGARAYDLDHFLGIRQARGSSAPAETEVFRVRGILHYTRHPWYVGALVILWARNLDTAALVTNLVLGAYLLVGTVLEERKLVREFGEAYRAYQRSVPMLVPWHFRGSHRS